MTKLRGNPWAVLMSLCLGFFMILLDVTIVNIAIPSIMDGLGATLDQILWVLDAYILVYAVLLITAGRLGDIVGPRNLFLAGMAVFVLASAWCGLAQDPSQLIVARAVQGVGAALLTPQTLTMITAIFPTDRRGAAMGVWGAVAGVATIAGPTLGGLIVTDWSWRGIFYVNVPIGVVAFTLAALIIPDLRPGRRHRLDAPGVVLATAGLFAIVFGLVEGQRYHWGRVWAFVTIPEIIAAGVVLLVVFVIVQRFEKREPLLPFAVLRDRNFSVLNVVGMALQFAMLGLFFPLTIYFQSVLGLSALAAGLTMAPMPLVSMLVAPYSGRLADRVGGKYVLMPGLALFACGMGLIIGTAHVDTWRWSFLPGLLVAGLGMGCIFAPLNAEAMRGIEPRLAGAASGLLNTSRQLGGVVGSAAVGALLQNRLAASLYDEAVDHASGLPAPFRGQFVDGFRHAARSGLEVGGGQAAGLHVPQGLPPQVAEQLRHLGLLVFQHGYVDAMRPTLVLPVAVLVLAAVCCLALRRRRRVGQPAEGTEDAALVGD
ncbi:MAG: MFS transporter [Streptosporangiaceae bacterium]